MTVSDRFQKPFARSVLSQVDRANAQSLPVSTRHGLFIEFDERLIQGSHATLHYSRMNKFR